MDMKCRSSQRFMYVYTTYLSATWGNINVKQQVSNKMLMQWLTHLAGKIGGNMLAIRSKWCLSSCFRWGVGSECRVSGSRALWSRRRRKCGEWKRVRSCREERGRATQTHSHGWEALCTAKKKILLPPSLIKQGKNCVFTLTKNYFNNKNTMGQLFI